MMESSKYIGLLTSQHNDKPKLKDSILTVIDPVIDTTNALLDLPALYEIDTAVGDQLRTIAKWVGAPVAIPNAVPSYYFGFEGQINSLEFGETGDPDAGGFWRESGMGNGTALPLDDVALRTVIHAQIYRNSCDATMADAKHILTMVTDVEHVLFDSQDMWIGVGMGTSPDLADIELIRAMLPRPSGVGIKFFENWLNGFGWSDQPDSLGFGDTSDPDEGGYWALEVA